MCGSLVLLFSVGISSNSNAGVELLCTFNKNVNEKSSKPILEKREFEIINQLNVTNIGFTESDNRRRENVFFSKYNIPLR